MISASEASGVACQRSSSPRAANSQVARNRRRISASKISDFRNQALRGRPRSGESGAPNQKSRTTEKPGAFTESLPGPAPECGAGAVSRLLKNASRVKIEFLRVEFQREAFFYGLQFGGSQGGIAPFFNNLLAAEAEVG